MENLEWICKLTGAMILGILAVIDVKVKKIPILFPLILLGITVLLRGLPILFEALGTKTAVTIETVEAIDAAAVLMDTSTVADQILEAGLDTIVGMFPGIIVLAVSVISKGQVGIGDGIVLTAAGGMLEGSESVEVFILSLLLVFIFSCIGLIIKKLSRKSALPFVPFYFAAYMGVVYL